MELIETHAEPEHHIIRFFGAQMIDAVFRRIERTLDHLHSDSVFETRYVRLHIRTVGIHTENHGAQLISGLLAEVAAASDRNV